MFCANAFHIRGDAITFLVLRESMTLDYTATTSERIYGVTYTTPVPMCLLLSLIPNAKVHYMDAFAFLETYPGKFDVIIMDIVDPIEVEASKKYLFLPAWLPPFRRDVSYNKSPESIDDA